MNKKETFIVNTSRTLRVDASIVRLVVEAWEHERKTPVGADHLNGDIEHVGGGWFLLPDGRKIQGRTQALEALRNG